jgi:3,4-dihydroxy 2-butanone 4-phosphate synthase/GTP cyclohydrolase II
MPTRWGSFRAVGYEREVLDGRGEVETAVALIMGEPGGEAPLLRIHSQCATGELFGSLRCDCREQLEQAMRSIAAEGRGLVIYEYKEGRGIGLMAKLQAYALQDAGLDTVDANHALGYRHDCRDFTLPAAILHELGMRQVRLLSNNPDKSRALLEASIEVTARLACEAEPTPHSLAYLRSKKERMGHTLHLEAHQQASAAEEGFPVASIEDALRELRAGRMVVVVDDEDRENEGDLTIAADMVTPEAINFMATHGRGLVCLAMTGERLDELELAPMASCNDALHGTAFTVSIDVKGPDVSTDISAHDRALTVRAAIDPSRTAGDFARPGHVFPLRARPGGVLERRGQTEAAVDLASLAGLSPAGVICEIVNDDGTMARGPDLARFCRRHGLLMVTVADLARHRLDADFEGALAALEGLAPACPRATAPLRDSDPIDARLERAARRA